jgi:hypothetical protein
MRGYTRRSLLHKIGRDYVQVILEMNDRAERLVLNQDNSTSTLHLEQPNSAWSMMTYSSNACLLGGNTIPEIQLFFNNVGDAERSGKAQHDYSSI